MAANMPATTLAPNSGPPMAAGVACTTKDGRVLLLRRKKDAADYGGTWDLPGGWIEHGEDPVEAARRELAEECGLTDDGVASLDFRPVHRHVYGDVDYVTYSTPVGEGFRPFPTNFRDPEHTAHIWAPIDNLPPDTHPGLKQGVNEVLEQLASARPPAHDEWSEADHPRDLASGEFTSGGGGGGGGPKPPPGKVVKHTSSAGRDYPEHGIKKGQEFWRWRDGSGKKVYTTKNPYSEGKKGPPATGGFEPKEQEKVEQFKEAKKETQEETGLAVLKKLINDPEQTKTWTPETWRIMGEAMKGAEKKEAEKAGGGGEKKEEKAEGAPEWTTERNKMSSGSHNIIENGKTVGSVFLKNNLPRGEAPYYSATHKESGKTARGTSAQEAVKHLRETVHGGGEKKEEKETFGMPKTQNTAELTKKHDGIAQGLRRSLLNDPFLSKTTRRDPNFGYGDRIEHEDNGGVTFSIRNLGQWENPPDKRNEEDYDWKQPNQETKDAVKRIVDKIERENPDVKVQVEHGEKNYTDFYISQKKAGGSEPKQEGGPEKKEEPKKEAEGAKRQAWSPRNQPHYEGNVELEPTEHYSSSHKISSKSGAKEVPSRRYNVYHNGQHIGRVGTHTQAEQSRGRGGPGFSTGRTLLRWSADPGPIGGRYSGGFRDRDDAIYHVVKQHKPGAEDVENTTASGGGTSFGGTASVSATAPKVSSTAPDRKLTVRRFSRDTLSPEERARQQRSVEANAGAKRPLPHRGGGEKIDRPEWPSGAFQRKLPPPRFDNKLDHAANIVRGALIAKDAGMALDWSGMFTLDDHFRDAELAELACDRVTARSYDNDGFLHIAKANISKSNVCPYLGKEIPDSERMGLDPNKEYQLWRHPDELAKGARTFNGKPILSKHVPVDSASIDPSLIVGTTGRDAVFDGTYLTNSLDFWPKAAIDGIETSVKRQLSCGYRYTADMRPGRTPQGTPYDGVMRDIVGNHVALVEEGRAGPDVIVADEAPRRTRWGWGGKRIGFRPFSRRRD